MMLILVVYYVIIAFLINMNVIADPASVPTKNGSSSIIVLNACSRDSPYFVSCIIGFGDVKLYRSAILDYADKSYFPYANTTDGLHVTIFKHINVQDPGTVIITKKLEDDEDTCFVVRGNYSTPIISKCLNVNLGETAVDRAMFKVKNRSSPTFIVKITHYEGSRATKSIEVLGGDERFIEYYANPNQQSVTGYNTFVLQKRDPDDNKFVYETIKNITQIIGAVDMCILVNGNFTAPTITPKTCVEI